MKVFEDTTSRVTMACVLYVDMYYTLCIVCVLVTTQ